MKLKMYYISIDIMPNKNGGKTTKFTGKNKKKKKLC